MILDSYFLLNLITDVRVLFEEKLRILEEACENGDDDAARDALRKVVPTYYRPEEINGDVGEDANDARENSGRAVAV